jgi:hypothetical protein
MGEGGRTHETLNNVSSMNWERTCGEGDNVN